MTLTPEQLAKSREEFEFEFQKLFPGADFERTIDGDYCWADVYAGFKIWLASRESLMVELPKPIHLRSVDEGCTTVNIDYFQLIERLNSAGINYREKE